MTNNRQFKIYTLGCRINQYDSASLKMFLEKNNFSENASDYDLAIINSCSVTKMAIHKAQKLINFIRKTKPESKIILIGCWPRVYDNLVDKEDVDLLWSGKSEDWANLLKKITEKFFPNDFFIGKTNEEFCAGFKTFNDRSRYFIKVQDGCRQFCSYCVIPFSRGDLSSKPSKNVISEIKEAVKNGYQEVILSGIHLGLYGKDFKNQKHDLFFLLKEILKIKELGRVRLSSIEINDLNDNIIKLIKESKGKICPHLHIPLQSGSDKILKLMNRPYDSFFFRERVKKIRKEIPLISISTDIIVGFPGESDQDFKDTCLLSKELAFAKIHVFSFSAHEKAAAYKFPNKNKGDIIKKRSEELRKLSFLLEQKHIKDISKKSKSFDLLIEKSVSGQIKGKTQFYFDYCLKLEEKNKFSKKDLKPGRIIKLNF